MTDATAGGRSGVGIRLYTTGGEVVRRTFDQVGDSGKKMWAQIALGEKASNPAMRAISRTSTEAREGVQGLADSTGAFGRSLGAFGFAGVAFAAVVGGMAIAVSQAREAMAFADEIDDSANKLQIGTDALQEYRYAMVVAGAEAKDFDSALAAFTKTLGAAQSGLSPKAMKPFAALGFTKEDLDAFDNGADALEEVSRRIAALSKESERAAVAEKLGLSPMLPLLRRGADNMENLRHKAQELGLVMDESLVKTGADATEQMDTISQVIKVQMSEAFVGLSEEIVAFSQHIADALKGLNNFIDRFNDWKKNAQRTGDYPNEFEQRAAVFGPVGLIVAAANNNRRRFNRWTGRESAPLPPLPTFEEKEFEREVPENRLESTSTRRGGGSNRAANEERQRERERERALDQLDREGLRAERDAVRARHASDTAEDRLKLAQETARLQREERDAQRATLEAELDRLGVKDEETLAAVNALKALHAEADTLADRAMLEEHRKDLAAEALRVDQAREDDALALLDIEAQLATTRDEQFRIERRILQLRQAAEARAREAALKEDKSLTDAERTARLGSLQYRNRLELDLFDQNERERQRSEFKSFGYDIADAIKEKRVGQHIADEMQQRLLDMALDGLFDFLNPRQSGGGGGGGGFFGIVGDMVGSLFSRGPGRAGGGGLNAGYRHAFSETGRPELLMLGADGHITSAAETRRMLLDMMQGGGGANGGRSVIEQHFHNDFKGAVMTEDLLKSMDAKAQQAAAAAEGRAIRTSVEITRRGAQARQQSLNRLGT